MYLRETSPMYLRETSLCTYGRRPYVPTGDVPVYLRETKYVLISCD